MFYVRQGELPRVKHTAFLKGDGKSLYREELVSTRGFSGAYSTKYHLNIPSAVLRTRELTVPATAPWSEAQVLYLHFFTDRKRQEGDFVTSRSLCLKNSHCRISTATPDRNSEVFFRNALASEYLFVHRGSGALLCDQGRISFGPGDQLVIPRATTYQLRFEDLAANKLLVVESDSAIEIPADYRNASGQLEEHAPYCERDLRVPQLMPPRDERGEFRVILKAGERWFEHVLPTHPFDLVGWDGFHFPYALNVHDFHPKVGRVHLPPPVHLAFRAERFVLCNFVPRPYDFHPQAIPAPYFHSNVDSDEVLYYVEGEFMSRKGIEQGSITLHPGGMPHGPQPGRTEASVGARETNELAIMIDTFDPLTPTVNVRETLDPGYAQSWL